ncbi:MAG: helix-turn-helix transcriptional regulator [Ruminococcaceae bacterium]|nr:helix-turn-helix transcriptional regulator [Oscillospiraceae bacterium]
MFNQVDFGKRVKSFRIKNNYSQKELGFRIGVSEQAVSKWENGECLPDVYNLKLLAQILRVSVDSLLDTEIQNPEKNIETITIGGARFDIVEKPETIFAGKIIYAKDFPDVDSFNSAIDSLSEEDKQAAFGKLKEIVLPIYDINLSINFWLDEKQRAFGFVREVMTEEQPDGADVYKMPSSLFIRTYANKETAHLISKEQCEIWELFAYIRDYFMPTHGFRTAQNGAQELEVFDTFEHKAGYAYIPVESVVK